MLLRDLWITRSVTAEARATVSSANLPNPAGSGGYEELAAIAGDPGMRRLAWRLAGDMADDLLQETWYAMARTAALESIENPRGYFYRTMVNTWRHLGQDLARHGIPADDLDAAAGAAGGVPSAEHDALARLDAADRRGRLRRQAGRALADDSALLRRPVPLPRGRHDRGRSGGGRGWSGQPDRAQRGADGGLPGVVRGRRVSSPGPCSSAGAGPGRPSGGCWPPSCARTTCGRENQRPPYNQARQSIRNEYIIR